MANIDTQHSSFFFFPMIINSKIQSLNKSCSKKQLLNIFVSKRNLLFETDRHIKRGVYFLTNRFGRFVYIVGQSKIVENKIIMKVSGIFF